MLLTTCYVLVQSVFTLMVTLLEAYFAHSYKSCCYIPQGPHAADHLSTTMSFASPLDETLDREVLLMLQGPNPEHMALQFKSILNKLVSGMKRAW